MTNDIKDNLIAVLRLMYDEDEVAHTFLDRAAARTNDVAETSIERIAAMADISRSEAIGLTRHLEEAGCGKLLVGRKGWKTRFRWDYSLPNLGRVAKGEEKRLQSVDPEVAKDAEDQQAAAMPSDDGAGSVPFTIAEAKRRLAEALGVTQDSIEIVVRG